MGIETALIGGLASGLSARSQRKAAKSAAAAQEQAAQAANETEWKMYQQGRKDLEPWRKQGAQSLSQLAGMMRPGTDMTTRFSAGDFKTDPGYQFRLQLGNQELNRSQAARGMLNSGAALKEAMSVIKGWRPMNTRTHITGGRNRTATFITGWQVWRIPGSRQAISWRNCLETMQASTAKTLARQQTLGRAPTRQRLVRIRT